MKQLYVRLLALAMVTIAGLFVRLGGPQELIAAGAYRCCQECNAAEAACKASCDSITHDFAEDDSLSACYQECDQDTEIYDCFTSCRDCETSPAEPCYNWFSDHGVKQPEQTTYHVYTWYTSPQPGICPF